MHNVVFYLSQCSIDENSKRPVVWILTEESAMKILS